MANSAPESPVAARNAAVRMFGRLQLLRLLGKSERTMAWLVADPRVDQELMLVLPRVQPADAAALERWQQSVRQAARLDHPLLAAVVETGVQDGWPYAAYDPRDSATLADRLGPQGLPAHEAAELCTQLLQGLAYAHEAGLAHHDLQPYLVMVGATGHLRLAGVGVASEFAAAGAELPGGLRRQRACAQRDVLACGVLLHQMLTGQPALDEPDIGRVITRMPPQGRELLRLAWGTEQPVPEALRAIANRSTDRQERQRYRGARTLLRALEGWLQSESSAGGGPLALLDDRLRSAGVLPGSPGGAERVARLATLERGHTAELAEVVLDDLALSFELLRLVNSAHVRGAQIAGSGPVLTVRRAIAMLGLDGVRRAALALRPWPGPLNEANAAELERLMARCRRAGRVAALLRPAGYDAEVVYLLTLLQNLGRLVVQYHFPEEALQIHRLMQPAPPARPEDAEDPGMSEEAAAYAVLGIDIESIGAAVARHWGLQDGVLHIVRRHSLSSTPRSADSDDELLRATASCANEAVDAQTLPGPRVAPALTRVVHRWGRLLGFGPRELQEALQGRLAAPLSAPPTAPMPLDDAVQAQR